VPRLEQLRAAQHAFFEHVAVPASVEASPPAISVGLASNRERSSASPRILRQRDHLHGVGDAGKDAVAVPPMRAKRPKTLFCRLRPGGRSY
jgi:hypothetical protein